jgi:hypothetical protein
MTERLVELFVKSDLRDLIKSLKKDKTYDEFLRDLISQGGLDLESQRQPPGLGGIT